MALRGDEVVGFMMFTYEWSDWYAGLWFEMQSVEGDLQSLQAMKRTMESYWE